MYLRNIILLFIFPVLVTYAQTPGEVGPVTNILSYEAFQGYDEGQAFYGEGEYQIYYDNVNGILDKIMIITDGFDPEDENTFSNLYNITTYGNPPQNMFDILRDQGIDIVLLNFPTYVRSEDGATINGGADYIERNGLILVQLIEDLKALQNGSNEFVVLGPSMGGLITRYALTYMEQNTLIHNTALWISYDSPHRGANVPIALQYAVNYLAEVSGDADMQALRDIRLNSNAAKQMLLDHYSGHLQGGSTYLQDNSLQLPIPHEYRTTFTTTMDALGFPTETRNIAIINGSLDAMMVESPGVTILDGSFDFGSNIGADITLHFTPDAATANYEIDYIQPTYLGIPVGDAFYSYAESPSYTAGLDSAPGGTFIFESFFGSDPTPFEQDIINALQVESFSFIPTLSSLNVNEQNWYYDVNGSESIPFDAYAGGNDNEPHMTFHEEYATFLYQEIMNVLSIDEQQNLDAFISIKNPVENFIEISVLEDISTTMEAKLYDLNGRLITQKLFTGNSGNYQMFAPKTSGIYLLNISTDDRQSIKKVIVR